MHVKQKPVSSEVGFQELYSCILCMVCLLTDDCTCSGAFRAPSWLRSTLPTCPSPAQSHQWLWHSQCLLNKWPDGFENCQIWCCPNHATEGLYPRLPGTPASKPSGQFSMAVGYGRKETTDGSKVSRLSRKNVRVGINHSRSRFWEKTSSSVLESGKSGLAGGKNWGVRSILILI